MEQIIYRKTLDVHKNGTQFLLQGFQTAEKLSRVIEISLMASGDALDFPLEAVVPLMYVASPGATEPSIHECEIKDNKVIYNVLPINVEGITTMQLKLIETHHDGAQSVVVSPKFAVEVTKSNAEDDGEELKATFTPIEDFIAKANAAYESRLDRIELTNDCIFKAYYYDGTTYETDILKKLFYNGNVLLSESYAHGGTGTRIDEDTDNSMYYSNISRSEALNAKAIMKNSEDILEEVKLHGMYTAFSVDFTTGEVEYVSPSSKFLLSEETGELDAIGQSYTFNEEVFRVVEDWLATNHIVISDLQDMAMTHSSEIELLQETISTHSEEIETLQTEVYPIERGGTGATTIEGILDTLGALTFERYDYIGDGNSGIDNKSSYTFKRKPKLIMLCDMIGGTNITFPYGQKLVAFIRYEGNNTSRNTEEYVHVEYDGLTIHWYGQYNNSTDNVYGVQKAQFNLDGLEYTLLGIG